MPKHRKTIGNNPLDSVIPHPKTNDNSSHPLQKEPLTSSSQKIAERVVKQRLTVHLSVGLIDRVKNAVYWTPGLTLASLAETAFKQLVDKLEEHRGEAFSPRTQNLKAGRPIL